MAPYCSTSGDLDSGRAGQGDWRAANRDDEGRPTEPHRRRGTDGSGGQGASRKDEAKSTNALHCCMVCFVCYLKISTINRAQVQSHGVLVL